MNSFSNDSLSILEATPDGLFTVNFTVTENEVAVAHIDQKIFSLKYKGKITAHSKEYEVYRAGRLKAAWVLDSGGGEAIAIIKRQGWLSRHFYMECTEGEFEIRTRWFSWTEKYELFHAGEKVGSFGLKKTFSRKFFLETTANLSLELRVFLIWFAIVQVSANSSDSSSVSI